MSIVTAIGDFFRSATTDKINNLDKYDILSPLMSVQEYTDTTISLVTLIEKDPKVIAILKSPKDAKNRIVSDAVKAFQDFTKALPNHSARAIGDEPFGMIVAGLTSMSQNLNHIETNFPSLFGGTSGEIDEENLRSSSLVIIGYIETVSEFCTWVGTLIRHLTDDEHDMIPPFETKSLTIKAGRFGNFVGFNMTRWDGSKDGILSTIKDLQRKGADVAIKAGDHWIDSFIHDNQFSPMEQDLLSASLRNPIMMIASSSARIKSYWLELLSTRKEWLVAKLAFESERLRGMDENSAEYKKLKKATEKYADLASKYEQRLERARS